MAKSINQKGKGCDKENQTYPALKIMGGRRYIKKRSSLKTKTCELFPLVFSRITIPVQRPCNQPQKQ